jgi:hypothetical protein
VAGRRNRFKGRVGLVAPPLATPAAWDAVLLVPQASAARSEGAPPPLEPSVWRHAVLWPSLCQRRPCRAFTQAGGLSFPTPAIVTARFPVWFPHLPAKTLAAVERLYAGGSYTQSRLVQHTLMHYKSFERRSMAQRSRPWWCHSQQAWPARADAPGTLAARRTLHSGRAAEPCGAQ